MRPRHVHHPGRYPGDSERLEFDTTGVLFEECRSWASRVVACVVRYVASTILVIAGQIQMV